MIDIPQYNLDANKPPPYWTGIKIDGRPAALFVCPNGHTIEVGWRMHDVDKLGYVTPEVVCAVLHCGFSKHIRLNGWRRWVDSLMREA